MNVSLLNECEPEDLPLCRSYVSVFFSPISTWVSSEAGTHPYPMLWAIGVLYDGRPDYLGCWPASGPKDLRWFAIAERLKACGVERIRFVIGPDPTAMQAAAAAHFRRGTWHCTALLASGTAIAPSVMDAVQPGHRPYIERALEVANPLSRRLKRLVARRGGFASPAAGAAVLRQSAERYVFSNWPESEVVPPPPLRAPAAATGSDLPAAAG